VDSAGLTVGVIGIIVIHIPVMTHDRREIDHTLITMTEIAIEIDLTKIAEGTEWVPIVVTFIKTEKTDTINPVIIPTKFFILFFFHYPTVLTINLIMHNFFFSN
jgi:hypothetical protein